MPQNTKAVQVRLLEACREVTDALFFQCSSSPAVRESRQPRVFTKCIMETYSEVGLAVGLLEGVLVGLLIGSNSYLLL